MNTLVNRPVIITLMGHKKKQNNDHLLQQHSILVCHFRPFVFWFCCIHWWMGLLAFKKCIMLRQLLASWRVGGHGNPTVSILRSVCERCPSRQAQKLKLLQKEWDQSTEWHCAMCSSQCNNIELKSIPPPNKHAHCYENKTADRSYFLFVVWHMTEEI